VTLHWETPPPARRITAYDRAREALAQRPGAWAQLSEGHGYIEARRLYNGLRTRGLEARIRKQEDDTYRIYGRYPEA